MSAQGIELPWRLVANTLKSVRAADGLVIKHPLYEALCIDATRLRHALAAVRRFPYLACYALFEGSRQGLEFRWGKRGRLLLYSNTQRRVQRTKYRWVHVPTARCEKPAIIELSADGSAVAATQPLNSIRDSEGPREASACVRESA